MSSWDKILKMTAKQTTLDKYGFSILPSGYFLFKFNIKGEVQLSLYKFLPF